MFGGYVGNPEADAEAFLPGGWFRTGDLGRLDEGGWAHCRRLCRCQCVVLAPLQSRPLSCRRCHCCHCLRGSPAAAAGTSPPAGTPPCGDPNRAPAKPLPRLLHRRRLPHAGGAHQGTDQPRGGEGGPGRGGGPGGGGARGRVGGCIPPPRFRVWRARGAGAGLPWPRAAGHRWARGRAIRGAVGSNGRGLVTQSWQLCQRLRALVCLRYESRPPVLTAASCLLLPLLLLLRLPGRLRASRLCTPGAGPLPPGAAGLQGERPAWAGGEGRRSHLLPITISRNQSM